MNDTLRKLLANELEHPMVSEFLSFAIEHVILEFEFQSEKNSFTELNKELTNLKNQLSKTSATLNELRPGTFNIGSPDLYSRMGSDYSEILGNRFGDKDTRKACAEFFLHLQVHGPKLLSFVLDSCKITIEDNLKNGHVARLKGANLETKKVRELIARVAGIYNILGGRDSYSETSKFVSIIEELFYNLGIDMDPSSAIKRAKEQDYYEWLKGYISGHPSYEMYRYYFNNHPEFKNKLSKNK